MLDTPEFENPPAWLADNFNITEGGTHAGKQGAHWTDEKRFHRDTQESKATVINQSFN